MSNRIVAVFPGRFQLPHEGHIETYKHLKKIYDKVFIYTSDKVEKPDSPFTFYDKKVMLTWMGADISDIIKCTSPYNPKELFEQGLINKDDILLFIVSSKDVDRFPPHFPEKSYLQYASAEQFETCDKHAYIRFAGTVAHAERCTYHSSTYYRNDFIQTKNKTRWIQNHFKIKNSEDYDSHVLHNILTKGLLM